MKCPYKCVKYIKHEYDNKHTSLETENFGECDGEDCPYWGTIRSNMYGDIVGCRRVKKEVE